jgi:hypothetical protein
LASRKYRIFGPARFLLRGLKGAQTEISQAAKVYHLQRTLKLLGGTRWAEPAGEQRWGPNQDIGSHQNQKSQKAMSGTPEHRFLII